MSVKVTLRRTWPVLLAYAVFSAWGLACLSASLLLTSGSGDLAALIGIAVATVIGHVAGNALGLVRLRLAVVFALFILLFIGGLFLAASLGPLGAYALVAMVAALSGYLGIASRLDVVAAWFPLSLSVGAAIVWMNRHAAITTFETGDKHAIWDPFAMVCLAGTVFLMLVFLATRNSLGLTAWQAVGRRGARLAAADGAPEEAEAHVDVARPGRGSIVVLFAFTVVVLAATAAMSPYLFRTAQDPNAKDGTSQADDEGKDKQGEGKGKPKQGKGKPKQGRGKGKGKGRNHGKGKGKHGSGHGDGSGNGGNGGNREGEADDGDDGDDGDENAPDTEHAQEAAGEAMHLAAKILMWLLIAAFAVLLAIVVFFPPIRRKVLLRHLERPLWPVAPTARVMNLWRRARAALADVGIEPELGEAPSAFATRATGAVQETLGCDAPGLAEAAAIVEKIDYAGRGLGTGDAAAMRAAVTALLATIAPRVAFGRRVKSWWGKPPEVES